ncbi:MAG: hypothetical protein ABIQ16_11390 [Polyangiaceae bacterium]
MAEGPRRFSLEYHGAPSCQQEAELVTEIQRRTPTAVRVRNGAGDVSIQITTEAIGSQQRAQVDVKGPDGPNQRVIEAPECSQVIHAVALILAIAIDPDAAPQKAEPIVLEPPAPLSPPAPRRLRERETARPPVWWAFGPGVGLVGGVAPHVALAQHLSFELGRGRSSGFVAHLKLSGIHAHGDVSARPGTADFDLLALRLASCPYRVVARVSVSACVSFDFGRLQGRGSQTLAEKSGSARWYGPGAFSAAELSVLDWLQVRLELGALAPLARDRFYFGPSETVHRIPALAGYGGLHLLVGG